METLGPDIDTNYIFSIRNEAKTKWIKPLDLLNVLKFAKNAAITGTLNSCPIPVCSSAVSNPTGNVLH